MLKYKLVFIYLICFLINAPIYAEDTLKERLEQHIYTLASDEMMGRLSGSKYAQMAANYIINQYEGIGLKPFFDDSYLQPIRFLGFKFQNIAGIIHGNDPVLKNEYIVIGAHYDHIGKSLFGQIRNGADDNASGVAAMIELARELKLNESDLKRSIIFVAFDAEERGLIGSTYFIDQWGKSLNEIKLMLSIDMVGWYEASGKVEYLGSGTINNGEEIILNSEIIPEGLNVFTKKFETSILTGTDTHPFAVKRIPTFHVYTGLKSPYHTTKDDAHLIDYDGMVLIVEHLSGLIAEISNNEVFLSSGKFARKHKSRNIIDFGISVNLDTFDYYYDFFAYKKKDKGTVISFGVGLKPQINFGIFAIRPELYYNHMSVEYPSDTMSINSITLPLSLVLQTPDHWIYGYDVFFGGYYSYHFNGKLNENKMDFTNTFNHSDAGITYGLNMNITKAFLLGFTSRISLMDFTHLENYNSKRIRNRSYLTLTYMF